MRIKPGVPQSGAMHTAHAGARVRRVAKQWEHKLATERGFRFWVETLAACRGCGYFFDVIILFCQMGK